MGLPGDEGEVHATIASFDSEEWKDDMKREINSINIRFFPMHVLATMMKRRRNGLREKNEARVGKVRF